MTRSRGSRPSFAEPPSIFPSSWWTTARSDATARVAREAGAEVLEQRPNAGKGAALRAGFRHALAAGYDGALTLDGDGQHDPAEIPPFLAAFGAAARARLPAAGRPPGASSPGPRRRPARLHPHAPARRLANTRGRPRLLLGGRDARAGQPVRVPPRRATAHGGVARRARSTASSSRWRSSRPASPAAGRSRGCRSARSTRAGPSHIRPAAHVRHFFRAVAAARRTVREARRPRA